MAGAASSATPCFAKTVAEPAGPRRSDLWYSSSVGEPAARMTYADYLVAEAASETRHEYLRGEVFSMAGGTPTHARLAMAVGVALSNALSGRPCGVFGSDLRIRIEGTDLSTYPDAVVV